MDKNSVTLDNLIADAAAGDKEAADFLSTIVGLADFYDAVADQDEHIGRHDVEQAIWLALVQLPRNGFYQRHFHALNAVLATAIMNWAVATDFERGNQPPAEQDYTLKIAYIIRSSYVDLFTTVALITGGRSHARNICKLARLFVHDEGWEGYLEALDRERTNRGEE